jgi:hypothetical protein
MARARAIHNDLVARPSEEAIAGRTVTKFLHEAQTSPRNATASSDTTSLRINDSDEAILRAVEELPFSSVRRLAYATHPPKATVDRRFSRKLASTALNL